MEVKLVLLQGQEKRIRRALKKNKGLRLTFIKKSNDAGDNDGGQQQQMSGTWLLKPSQWKVYNRAVPNSTFRLTFSAADLAKNVNHSGGFLGLLAAILGPIIGGVAGAAVDRAISGAGVSFAAKRGGAVTGGGDVGAKKKRGALLLSSSSPRAYSLVLTKHLRSDNAAATAEGGGGGGINSRLLSCRVAPAPDGNGLYLSPWTKNHPRDGAGLWLTPHPSQTHHHPHGGDIRVHRPTRSAHPILKDSYSKTQKRIMENFLL